MNLRIDLASGRQIVVSKVEGDSLLSHHVSWSGPSPGHFVTSVHTLQSVDREVETVVLAHVVSWRWQPEKISVMP